MESSISNSSNNSAEHNIYEKHISIKTKKKKVEKGPNRIDIKVYKLLELLWADYKNNDAPKIR